MKITNLITFITVLLMSTIYIPVLHIYVNTGRIIGFNILRPQYLIAALHLLIFMKKGNVFYSNQMIMVYLYALLYLVFRISGHYDTTSQWFGMYHLPVYMSVLLYTYYTESKDYRGLGIVMLWVLIFLTLSSAINFYQLNRYPDAVRGVSGGLSSKGYERLSEFYLRIGVANYSFISGISYILPAIISIFKYTQNNTQKFLIITSLAVIYYSIFVSAISAPILIGLIGIILSIIGRRRSRQSLGLIVLFVLFVIVVPRSMIANVFYIASENISNSNVAMKMKDIGISVEEGIDTSEPSNEIESRAQRIPQNLEQFSLNPVFGTGVEANAHIFWLNLLAQFGLVGTLPLVLILYFQFRRNLKVFTDDFRFYYILSIALFVILGFMKAVTGPMIYYVLWITPGIYYLRYLKKSKPEINQQPQTA